MGRITEEIKFFRKAKKISQSDLAGSIGISKTHLSNIESGKANPTMKILEDISVKLECNWSLTNWA